MIIKLNQLKVFKIRAKIQSKSLITDTWCSVFVLWLSSDCKDWLANLV